MSRMIHGRMILGGRRQGDQRGKGECGKTHGFLLS